MNKPQSITTLEESPDAERNRRMTQYFIAMIIRVLCVFACFFVQGWWLLVPATGAIVLPYVAVVIGNASRRAPSDTLESVAYALPPSRRDDADQ